MPRPTTILGPIHLSDPERNRERTSAQVLSVPGFDSRLPEASKHTSLTYEDIRRIRRDPTVQLARAAVLAPILHTPWSYKVKSNAPSGAKELIEGMLEPQRDWFLQTAVYGALDFGWQPFEIVYKFNGTNVVVSRLKPLLQDYTTILVYEETGDFAGFANEPVLIGSSTRAVLLREKYSMNINFTVEGTDWYGYSVYNSLYDIDKSWNTVEAAASRYDRKVSGATWVIYYPVGETPYNGTTKSNDEIATELLSIMEGSGSVAIPDEIQEFMDDTIEKEMKGKWRVELLSAPASVSTSFIDRQKYLDNLKMRAFHLPERSILEGSHGTKAEADSHGSIALSTIDTKHRLLCDLVNEHLIDKVLAINYGEEYRGCVCVHPAPLIDMQYNTLKEIYRLIVQSPDTLLREYGHIDTAMLRKELGIPESSEPEIYDTKEDTEDADTDEEEPE